ncbi:MAG: hypothetical protein WAM21_04605, partial [Steroidobacteraceae bacterium]
MKRASANLNRKRAAAATSGLGTAVLLCACTVGPNFHRPAAPATPGYRFPGESRPVGTAAAAAQRAAPA